MFDWYDWWVLIGFSSMVFHLFTRPISSSLKTIFLNLFRRFKLILIFIFEGPLVPIFALALIGYYFVQ